jgi:hypothetical protein
VAREGNQAVDRQSWEQVYSVIQEENQAVEIRSLKGIKRPKGKAWNDCSDSRRDELIFVTREEHQAVRRQSLERVVSMTLRSERSGPKTKRGASCLRDSKKKQSVPKTKLGASFLREIRRETSGPK